MERTAAGNYAINFVCMLVIADTDFGRMHGASGTMIGAFHKFPTIFSVVRTEKKLICSIRGISSSCIIVIVFTGAPLSEYGLIRNSISYYFPNTMKKMSLNIKEIIIDSIKRNHYGVPSKYVLHVNTPTFLQKDVNIIQQHDII